MYKYETHFHTGEVSPCGKVIAAEGIRLYAEYGYDGVIVTDHFYNWRKEKHPTWKDYVDFYLKGYRNAKEAGERYGIKVFLGAEFRFDENANDYLAFGFDEKYLYETENLMGMTLQEYKRSIRQKDILVFQAHPFRPGITSIPPEYLHGVEVFNGNPRHESNNEKAMALAQKNGLLPLSGSDFHQIMDLARGGIITENPCFQIGDLLKALRTGAYEWIVF